jgi:hypothetical protein
LRNNPIITCNHNTTQHNPSTILHNIIRDNNITCHEVIVQPIEEQDEPEEVSDVGEDQSHVTIANNQDIMDRNSHYH